MEINYQLCSVKINSDAASTFCSNWKLSISLLICWLLSGLIVGIVETNFLFNGQTLLLVRVCVIEPHLHFLILLAKINIWYSWIIFYMFINLYTIGFISLPKMIWQISKANWVDGVNEAVLFIILLKVGVVFINVSFCG